MKTLMGMGKHRLTLRLPDAVVEQLKKESEEKVLPVNAIINRILTKYVIYETRMNSLTHISLPQALFSNLISQLDESQKEKITEQSSHLVQKLFTMLNIEYNLRNVIDEYFFMLSSCCGWYTFHSEKNYDKYRLVFESKMGIKWIQFLSQYIKNILQSLKVNIINESIDDSILVFELKE